MVFIMELANPIQIQRTACLADSAFSLSVLILMNPLSCFYFLPFNYARVEIAQMEQEGL